jgi:hypothetical protein
MRFAVYGQTAVTKLTGAFHLTRRQEQSNKETQSQADGNSVPLLLP